MKTTEKMRFELLKGVLRCSEPEGGTCEGAEWARSIIRRADLLLAEWRKAAPVNVAVQVPDGSMVRYIGRGYNKGGLTPGKVYGPVQKGVFVDDAGACRDANGLLAHGYLSSGQLEIVPPAVPAPEAPAGLDAIVADVFAWQDATFTKATPESCLAHLKYEVLELEKAPRDPMEWADVILLGIGGAHKAGYDPATIIAEKMKVNKTRKWGNMNPAGFMDHVRDDPEAPAVDGLPAWDGKRALVYATDESGKWGWWEKTGTGKTPNGGTHGFGSYSEPFMCKLDSLALVADAFRRVSVPAELAPWKPAPAVVDLTDIQRDLEAHPLNYEAEVPDCPGDVEEEMLSGNMRLLVHFATCWNNFRASMTQHSTETTYLGELVKDHEGYRVGKLMWERTRELERLKAEKPAPAPAVGQGWSEGKIREGLTAARFPDWQQEKIIEYLGAPDVVAGAAMPEAVTQAADKLSSAVKTWRCTKSGSADERPAEISMLNAMAAFDAVRKEAGR